LGTDCQPPDAIARAITETLAARQRFADERMGLESLELVERRQRRVLVVEMNDESDGNQPVIVMVQKGTSR